MIRVAQYAVIFSMMISLGAAQSNWTFPQDGVGSFLPDGTWAVVNTLDQVSLTPEFSFPIQLVYHNANRRSGLFGPQWFSPQLESSLLPGKNGVLIWQTPSGGIVGLHAKRGSSREFISGMDWTAKQSGSVTEITSRQDGRIYRYKGGQLQNVESPSHRILEFQYRQSLLTKVVLRETLSDARLVVTDVKLMKGRAAALTVGNAVHKFGYHPGQPEALSEYLRPGLARPEKYEYDKKVGVLEKIISPTGETHGLVCDQSKATKGRTDRCQLLDDGNLTYESESKAGETSIKASNLEGQTVSLTLVPKRGILTRTEPNGIVTTTYYYRAPGQRYDGKLRRIEHNGRTLVDHKYDAKTGRLIESKDAKGQISFFKYPPLPRGVDEEHPLYDKPSEVFRGNRQTQERIASLTYDAAGRVTKKVDVAEQESVLKYSSRGELATVVAPDGRETQIQRDALGHILSVGDGSRQQKAEYDERTGKVKFRQLPDGQYVDYVRDDLGRVKEIQQNRQTVAAYDYDDLGRVVAKRDGLKRESRLVLDSKGKILEEHQPNGVVTSYEYDARGLRTAQIDGKGNRITFQYNEAGKLIEQKNPMGQKLTWTYDEAGLLLERTNGAQIVKYGYDPKDRLTVINYGRPGEKIVQTYDAKGRLVSAASPTITVNLSYDALNRVIARQLIRGKTERVLRTTYNPANQKTSVVLSEKDTAGAYRILHQTEYTYDPAGNLAALKANSRLICQYVHDPIGRLIQRKYGNGIVADYRYDDFGHLSQVDLQGGPLSEPMVLAYQWDLAGQVTSRIWNQEAQNFTYDGSGQLLTVSAMALDAPSDSEGLQKVSLTATDVRPSELVEKYAYDAAGNIVEKFEHGLTTTMSYDAANQLVGGTQTNLTSGGARSSVPSDDPALNVTPQPASPTSIQYHYDAAGRQTRIEGPEGIIERRYGWLDKVIHLKKSDGSVLAFDYYPDGQLAAKGPLGESDPNATGTTKPATEEKKKTGFAYLRSLIQARSNVAAEFDESLQATPEQLALQPREEFVWDGLALLWKSGTGYAVEPHPSGGTCVAAFESPEKEPIYFLNDILGTTLAAVKQGQVQIIPMTAFGKPLKAPALPSPPEDIPPPSASTLSHSNNATGELAGNIKPTTP